MYIEGVIVEIDKQNYKVKLKVEELDNFITPWLSVVQLYAVKNKSGFMPELDSLAAAVLSDDMTYGACLGVLYNGVDNPPEDKNDTDFIQYEDGVVIEHKKDSKTLKITAENLIVNGNISATGDISDKKGTIQAIRDWSNSHKHTNGNNGSNTGVPTEKI